jgi:hypothetical protein
MDLNTILPLTSTIISIVFAILVFDQFLDRRKPYQLVWTVGLIWYGASAFTEFYGNSQGWNEIVYRYWYLIGAFFVAAYLGMGTTYLLTPRWFAHIIMALLLLGSVYAAYRVFTAPVDPVFLPKVGEIVTGKALPKGVRIMTPFFNTFGAGALILGALYSAWVFWRQRILPHRVVSNTIIAIGAFIPSITGLLNRMGLPELFFAGELAGVLIIFIGFLVSIEVFVQFKLPFTQVVLGQRRIQE